MVNFGRTHENVLTKAEKKRRKINEQAAFFMTKATGALFQSAPVACMILCAFILQKRYSRKEAGLR